MSRHSLNRTPLRALSTAALLGIALVGTVPQVRPLEAEPTAARHLTVVHTSPSADSTVTGAPAEIRVTFSEVPRVGGTTLRLTTVSNAFVAATTAARNADNPAEYVFRPQAPMPAGAYTVHWRTISSDGHTVRGTFEFRVTAE